MIQTGNKRLSAGETIYSLFSDLKTNKENNGYEIEGLGGIGWDGNEGEGSVEDRGATFDDEESDPTIEGSGVDKDELEARFERLKRAIASKKENAINSQLEDLQDFIDSLD